MKTQKLLTDNPPNLRAHLVKSSLTPPTNNGTSPCRTPRCQLCRHINPSTSITGPNNATFTIKGSHTCNSSNVVYAISCQQCPRALYIGQTGQSLRQWINGHKFDIRHQDVEKPVSQHFNLPGHSITDLRVAVLKQENFKTRMDREAEEQKIIHRLDCIGSGLNRDRGFMSHYHSQL